MMSMWSGLVVSASGQCHCTIGCIHVVHSYLVRKANINYYKFYKCNVAVKC